MGLFGNVAGGILIDFPGVYLSRFGTHIRCIRYSPQVSHKEKLVDSKLVRMAGILGMALIALGACSKSGDRGNDARLQGLRTVVYAAPDLAVAKQWYTEALGIEPYFDEPFYVGFDVGGYELALDPDRTIAQPPGSGAMVFWGVEDVEAELNRLMELGAKPHLPFHDVGGGIKVGAVLDPFGNALGLIYNPFFEGGD